MAAESLGVGVLAHKYVAVVVSGGLAGGEPVHALLYAGTLLAAGAPQLVTLLVLAVASQRLRPPAAIGMEYRRGEGD